MHVTVTRDLRQFAADAQPVLNVDPIRYNILAGAVDSIRDGTAHYADPVFLLARQDGAVIGAAMHTPPYGPLIPTEDPLEAALYAEELAAAGREITGQISGPQVGVTAFAERWVELRGGGHHEHMHLAVYELLGPVAEPTGVFGAARRADIADLPRITAFVEAFATEARTVAGSGAADLAARIESGGFWVWEQDGLVVCQMSVTAPTPDLHVLSLIYTPPEERGRGYATALVASAATAVLAGGGRCMLYTDLENETANRIYRGLGFRQIGNWVQLKLDPPA